ncbi:quinone reductase-like [Clavelina lepadiformis]|uniref:NADPH-dependent FMN reductase-like domain-containing protein n=1 Tax=Clavelina lepadiformis TaxID=159417 RepID=A0ABP0H265_CLALP
MAKVWKNVVVFMGSTRENRLCERVTAFIVGKLKEKNLNVTVVDPKEFVLPLLTKPVHFYRSPEEPPKQLVEMDKKILESDAIVVVSGEYNHCIPPGLTNTMDYFGPKSFANKPSGIVTYSPSNVAGARAGVQLRSLLGELGCISVSNMFAIPRAHKALTENGVPQETEEGSHMDSAVGKLLTQLEWWANAAKSHREAATNNTQF